MRHSLRTHSIPITLLASTALVVGIAGCGGDLSELQDDDLTTVTAEIRKYRNAITALGHAIELLNVPEDSTEQIELMLLGHEWDDAGVEELLEKNVNTFVFFERAIGREGFQVRVKTSHGEQVVLDRWMMLARLRALKIRALAREGDAVAALDDLIELAGFGTRVRGLDGGRIVHHLIGTSLVRIALTTLESMLIETPLTREQAKVLIAKVEALRIDREGWQRVLAGDYQWRAAVLDESIAARGGDGSNASRDPFAREVLDSMVSLLPHGYTLQRNRTLDRLANHYRAYGDLPGTPCRESDPHRAPGAKLLGGPPDPMTFEQNAIGNYWADLTGITFSIHHDTMCVADSFASAIVAMIALRAYETENGTMPEALDALVPDYLDSVPIDYFGGGPLRYSREEHLLYSIGTDFVDAKGVHAQGERCTSELAWPIPFAADGRAARPPERLICATPRS